MASLQRLGEFNGATIGLLRITGVAPLWTLEDAWNGNKKGNSCIPVGIYTCIPHGWAKDTTVKRKQSWELVDVEGRSAILIHEGNTIGDTAGCVLVGTGINISGGKAALVASKDAMNILRGKFFGVGLQLKVLAAPVG